MKNQVDRFQIFVADIARAKAFYEAVLKISLSPPTPTLFPFAKACHFPMPQEAGRASVSLISHPLREPQQKGTIIYFSSTDCAIETARVEPAGGKVMQTKSSIGEFGFTAIAMDTEGNLIGFRSFQ